MRNLSAFKNSGNFILDKKTIIKSLLLIFIGFFGLSTFSSTIFSFLHIPVYLFEIFIIIPCIFLVKRKKKVLHDLLVPSSYILLLLLIIVVSAVVGVIKTKDVFNIVTYLRAIVYFLLTINYCLKNNCSLEEKTFYLLAIGWVLGESLYLIYTKITSPIVHFNAVGLCFFVFLPASNKRIKLFVLFSLISLILSFASLYRRHLFACTISIVFASLFLLKDMKNNTIKNLIIFIGIALLVILYFYAGYFAVSIANAFGPDSLIVKRFLSKIISLLSGETNPSDLHRLSLYSETFDSTLSSFFPNGSIFKHLGEYYYGSISDVPLRFLYDVFGSFVSFILIGVCLFFGAKKMLDVFIFKEVNDWVSNISGMFFPVFVFLIVFDGMFLVFPTYSIIFGVCTYKWFVPLLRTPEIQEVAINRRLFMNDK